MGARRRRAEVSLFGTSAAFLAACMKAGVATGRDARPVAASAAIGSTGSPLAVEVFGWVYDAVKPDVWLASHERRDRRRQRVRRRLPAAARPRRRAPGARRSARRSRRSTRTAGRSSAQTGELVLTAPLPSMPVFFWNDPDGPRYRESYFEMYPGVWRHGDWIRITERGSAVIEGRSDSTLNRQGIRFGTSELYGVVEAAARGARQPGDRPRAAGRPLLDAAVRGAGRRRRAGR